LAGEPVGAALHTAQLQVLQRQPHPFHWAGFALVGRVNGGSPASPQHSG
jgi:CHAT domain-containing protein